MHRPLLAVLFKFLFLPLFFLGSLLPIFAYEEDDQESVLCEFLITFKGASSGTPTLTVTFDGNMEPVLSGSAYVYQPYSETTGPLSGAINSWSTPVTLLIRKGMPLDVLGRLKIFGTSVSEYKIVVNVPDPKYQSFLGWRENYQPENSTVWRDSMAVKRRMIHWIDGGNYNGYLMRSLSSTQPHEFQAFFKRLGEGGDLAGRSASAMPGWQNTKIALGYGVTGKSLGYLNVWKGFDLAVTASSTEVTSTLFSTGDPNNLVNQVVTPSVVFNCQTIANDVDSNFGSQSTYTIRGFNRAFQTGIWNSSGYWEFGNLTPFVEYKVKFVPMPAGLELKTKIERTEGSTILDSYAFHKLTSTPALITYSCTPPACFSSCAFGSCFGFCFGGGCVRVWIAPASQNLDEYIYPWSDSGAPSPTIGRNALRSSYIFESTGGGSLFKQVYAVGTGDVGNYSLTKVDSGRASTANNSFDIGVPGSAIYKWQNYTHKSDTIDPTGVSSFVGTSEYYSNGSGGARFKLKKRILPDGNWEYLEYYSSTATPSDVASYGMLKRITRPDYTTTTGDTPSSQLVGSLVTEYTYTQNWDHSLSLPSEVVTRKIAAGGPGPNDVVVSRVSYDYSGSNFDSDQPAYEQLRYYVTTKKEFLGGNVSDAVTTLTKRFRADEDPLFADLPLAVLRSDGTADMWLYKAGTYTESSRSFSTSSSSLHTVLSTFPLRSASSFQTWKVAAFSASAGGFVLDPTTPQAFVVPWKSTAEVTTRDSFGRIRLVETYVAVPLDESWTWRQLSAVSHDYDVSGGLTASYEYVRVSPTAGEWRAIYEARYTQQGTTDVVDYASVSFNNSVGSPTGRKQVERDRDGVITLFKYDKYGRVEKTLVLQPPVAGTLSRPPLQQTIFAYDADDRVVSTSVGASTTTLTKDSAALESKEEFNLAGLPTRRIATGGYSVEFSYSNGGRTVTETRKGTDNVAFSTLIKDNYLDGRPKSLAGTGAVAEFFSYPVLSGASATIGGTSRLLGTPQKISSVGSSTAHTTRKTTLNYNWLGKKTREELSNPSSAGNQVTDFYYDLAGRLIKSQSAGLAPVLYEYNWFGELYRWGMKLDTTNPGALVDDSLDRISTQSSGFSELSPGILWEYTQNSTYPNSTVGTRTTPSVLETTYRKRTMEAFTSNVSDIPNVALVEDEVVQVAGSSGSITRQVRYRGRGLALGVSTDSSAAYASQGLSLTLNGRPVRSFSPTGFWQEWDYDASGRTTRSRSRAGEEQLVYLANTTYPQWRRTTDNIWTETGYLPTGQIGWTKQYTTKTPTVPAGTAAGIRTSFSYNTRGQTTRIWGDNAYPTEYIYYENGSPSEVIGLLYEQRTFNSTTPAWNSATWPLSTGTPNQVRFVYFPESALVKEKQYLDTAAGVTRKTSYTYNARRDLKTRVWNAGGATATTTYNYYEAAGENTGELKDVDYPAGAYTTDLSYAYNRSGTLSSVTDATGVRQFTYRPSDLQLDNEALPPAFYGNGSSTLLTRDYDAFGRLSGFWFGASSSTKTTWVDYSYDGGSGRVAEINTPSGRYSYGYLAGSDLIVSLGVPVTGGQLFQRRDYASDSDHVLQWNTLIGDTPASGMTVAGYDIRRDARNRIYRFGQTGGIFSVYGSGVSVDLNYNDRNEVQGARSYLSGNPNDIGGTAVEFPRRLFSFDYDSAGNRKSTQVGTSAADQDTALTYTPNQLGQYASRQRAHHVEVTGLVGKGATPTATRAGTAFTVSSLPLTSPDYNLVYGKGVRAAGTAAAMEAVAVTSTRASPSASTTQTRNVLAPAIPASGQASESFTHDQDGNLTQDAFWDYRYDAENRVRQIETRTGLPASIPKLRLTFLYDYLGRRVRKTVETWNGTSYAVTADRVFAYDAWNLIAEYTASGTTVTLDRTYHWGLDLSGSIHGAAGVGGLLGISYSGSTPRSYLAVNDFNGNVVALVDPVTGWNAAAYEYGAFGESLRVSGSVAGSNPIRFSSRYYDSETELVNSGYRYYSPSLGRFINRDPLEEYGRLQLQAPIMENAVAVWNYIGAQGGTPGKSPQQSADTSLAKTSLPHSDSRIGGSRNSTQPGNVIANRKGSGGGGYPGLFIAYAAPPIQGAANAYAYVGNAPYGSVDPLGLTSFGEYLSNFSLGDLFGLSDTLWGRFWGAQPKTYMSPRGVSYAEAPIRPPDADISWAYVQGTINRDYWGVDPGELVAGMGRDVLVGAATSGASRLMGGGLMQTTIESQALRTERIAEVAVEASRPGLATRISESLGIFSSATKWTANANRIAHTRAVDDFIGLVEANGLVVRGREVTFNTPFGARRMDVILENPQTGLIGGVEIKSSVGAFDRFDQAARQQFSADRWINTHGATSVGEQSGISINNTIKILWPAPAP